MLRHLLPLNRLQRKVVNTILVMVVVPMLVAGMLASEWVSSNFEERLQRWIEDSSPAGQTWLRAYQNDADLRDADLRDADRRLADLTGAKYNRDTIWPDGFDPVAARESSQ